MDRWLGMRSLPSLVIAISPSFIVVVPNRDIRAELAAIPEDVMSFNMATEAVLHFLDNNVHNKIADHTFSKFKARLALWGVPPNSPDGERPAGDYTLGPEVLRDPYHKVTLKRNIAKHLNAVVPAMQEEVCEALDGSYALLHFASVMFIGLDGRVHTGHGP
jgi:hypothetical protein